MNWSFLKGISLLRWTDRQFIEYIHFRLDPPETWIGSKACPRFVSDPALPFSEWKPCERWRLSATTGCGHVHGHCEAYETQRRGLGVMGRL
jgi:hypothetical protein